MEAIRATRTGSADPITWSPLPTRERRTSQENSKILKIYLACGTQIQITRQLIVGTSRIILGRTITARARTRSIILGKINMIRVI
jgi:hypothetical protein